MADVRRRTSSATSARSPRSTTSPSTSRDGEFLTLLGPSGCGKSTTLAAHRRPRPPDLRPHRHRRRGGLRFGDRHLRRCAVPQSRPDVPVLCALAAYDGLQEPRLSRWSCAASGAQRRGSASPRRSRSSTWRRYAERYPGELSGGQQQRVALARTLVYRPRDPPSRRAAVQPRRQAAGSRPHLAGRLAAPHRRHHHLRDARPGRSAGAERPDHRHGWRPHRPDRHAAGHLRAAAGRLRRRFRRRGKPFVRRDRPRARRLPRPPQSGAELDVVSPETAAAGSSSRSVPSACGSSTATARTSSPASSSRPNTTAP